MAEPAGKPAEPPDRVEIWAKRTGRALGYAVATGLVIYLLYTYGSP